MKISLWSEIAWLSFAIVELTLLMATIFFGILVFHFQRKLFGLVRQLKPETHSRLTTFWGSVGGRNSLKGIEYIQSEEDDENADIFAAKKLCKKTLFRFLFLFLSLFLFPVFLGVGWMFIVGIAEKLKLS